MEVITLISYIILSLIYSVINIICWFLYSDVFAPLRALVILGIVLIVMIYSLLVATGKRSV